MTKRRAEEIINDKDKGAAELMIDVYDSIKDSKEERVKEYAAEIVKNRYSMTPLVNMSNIAFLALGKGKDLDEAIENYKKRVEKSKKATVNKMREIIERNGHDHVATFSYSSTVISSLEDVKKTTVFESRPLKEGRKSADILSSKGIEVEYWIDAGMTKALGRCDAVVIGADTVSYEGFLNKLGTYPLVLSAEEHDIQVYVAADISKYLPGSLKMSEGEIHTSEEVWSTDKDIKVHNEYFEKIPLRYTKFVTGEEVLEGKEIKTKIMRKEVSDMLKRYYPLR